MSGLQRCAATSWWFVNGLVHVRKSVHLNDFHVLIAVEVLLHCGATLGLMKHFQTCYRTRLQLLKIRNIFNRHQHWDVL